MEIHKKTVEIVWIEYDGIKWYPDRRGYWIGSVGKKKLKRLHIYVWEKYNGPVPKGYHVHHKDHNPNNNDIENLELIPASEHLSMHGKENSEQAAYSVRKYAVPEAIEWHKSADGTEWHKRQYQKTIAPKWGEKVTKTCIVCGKPFERSVLTAHRAKFCSNACKSKYRRDMKLDNIEKACEYCGKLFWSNKYDNQRFCSTECRNKGRSAAMKGVKKSEYRRQG